MNMKISALYIYNVCINRMPRYAFYRHLLTRPTCIIIVSLRLSTGIISKYTKGASDSIAFFVITSNLSLEDIWLELPL